MRSQFQKPVGEHQAMCSQRRTHHCLQTFRYLPIVCSYGLLASVLSDQRDDFDQFLLFYNHFENSQGLMCWQQVRYHACSGAHQHV